MASIVRSATARVVVESGVFGLQDIDTAATPVPWPQDLLAPGDGLLARPNRLDIECGVRDLAVQVRLEAWDGSPPEPTDPEGGLDVEEDELTLSPGTVRLWELTGGGSAMTFEVGPPGRYALRCVAPGQSAPAELVSSAERVPDGTVQYVFSFWPAA